MTPAAALEAIGASRIVAVIRARSAKQVVDVVQALRAGGILAVEIALTTPGAASAVREARARWPDLLVGAGTVRTTEDLTAVLDAGAAFLASPGTSVEVLDEAARAGVLAIPGVFTPTEVERVSRLAPLLKLFPAGAGGPPLLRALLGPYPDLRFMPTGGVVADTVADWFAAGAFAVAAGTDLCPIEARDPAAITARARAYVEAAAR